jgi:hypothetical protein
MRDPKLLSRKQSDDNIISFFDRYYHHVLDLHKAPVLKKVKMALTFKFIWLLGEAFVVGLTSAFWLKFGLMDIKTIIGLLFVVAFGVIKVMKGIVEYQQKKQDLRERLYEFHKNVEKDKRELNISITDKH